LGRCGDGSVDAGEDCDDGNEVNSDGCNTDCRESGSTLWTIDFAADYDVPDFPLGGTLSFDQVAVAQNGSIGVAAGILLGGTEGENAILIGDVDVGGDTSWTDVISSDEAGHHYFSVGLSRSDEALVTCGFHGTGLGSAFVIMYSADGERIWTVESNTPSSGAFDCILLPDGDVMTIGNESQDTDLRRYDGADGSLVWSDGDGASLAFALARRSDGLIAVATEDPASVQYFTENGVLDSTFDLPLSPVHGLATGPDFSEVVATAAEAMKLRRYEDGLFRWERALPAAGYGAVAIDSAGAVVVVGRANDDIWVRKLSPDGNEVWTNSYAGNGGGEDIAKSVAIGSDDSILVFGTENTQDGVRTWLRKYAP
jgi:cysteine-rich repeat protein